nr:hypothetical protein [Mesorhizobium sp.]
MKRYEKPRLDKRVSLQAVAAQSMFSLPPDSTDDEDDNGEGGTIS